MARLSQTSNPMPTEAAQLFNEIAADVADALDRKGNEIVEAVKEDLSVPVQITTGPRGGRVVIRSKPGEHPRKESGDLQAAVGHQVQRDGVDATLVVNDPMFYAPFLDPKLNRPILTGIDERFGDDVVTAVVTAIQGGESA